MCVNKLNLHVCSTSCLEVTYHACPWLLCPLLLFRGSRLNKEDVVDTVDFTDAIDIHIHILKNDHALTVDTCTL